MTIRRATFKYRRSYDACSMLGKEKKGKFRVLPPSFIIITITLQRKSQSILVYMKRCRNRPLSRHAIDVTCRVENRALLESQQLVD